MEEKSLFELILTGKINAYKIYEDDLFFAILDINPKQQGHTLLIPKAKKKNILEEDENTSNLIHQIAKKLSLTLMQKLNASGIKWQYNINKSAGQEIFHTHLHLIPYYDKQPELRTIDELAKLLKA